jgi:hypothetical protein
MTKDMEEAIMSGNELSERSKETLINRLKTLDLQGDTSTQTKGTKTSTLARFINDGNIFSRTSASPAITSRNQEAKEKSRPALPMRRRRRETSITKAVRLRKHQSQPRPAKSRIARRVGSICRGARSAECATVSLTITTLTSLSLPRRRLQQVPRTKRRKTPKHGLPRVDRALHPCKACHQCHMYHLISLTQSPHLSPFLPQVKLPKATPRSQPTHLSPIPTTACTRPFTKASGIGSTIGRIYQSSDPSRSITLKAARLARLSTSSE